MLNGLLTCTKNLYPTVNASGACTKLLYNAPHNISRCRAESRQWRDSHTDQVCTKRGQPGKKFFHVTPYLFHGSSVQMKDVVNEKESETTLEMVLVDRTTRFWLKSGVKKDDSKWILLYHTVNWKVKALVTEFHFLLMSN